MANVPICPGLCPVKSATMADMIKLQNELIRAMNEKGWTKATEVAGNETHRTRAIERLMKGGSKTAYHDNASFLDQRFGQPGRFTRSDNPFQEVTAIFTDLRDIHDLWWQAFDAATQRVDVLGVGVDLLIEHADRVPTQEPPMDALLGFHAADLIYSRQKAGCSVRLNVTTPKTDSPSCHDLELLAGGLPLMIDGPHTAIRYGAPAIDISLIRADDDMLVIFPTQLGAAQDATALHLTDKGVRGLFEKYDGYFTTLWHQSSEKPGRLRTRSTG